VADSSFERLRALATQLAGLRVDVIAANPVTLTHQAQIVELAAKNRLPAMYRSVAGVH